MQNIEIKSKDLNIFLALCLGAVLVLVPVLGFASNLPELNQDISEKKEEIEKLEERIDSLGADIAAKQHQALSLKNQIAILDSEVKKTENEIEKTRIEIEKVSLEIRSVEIQIQEKEQQLKKQKEALSEFIKVIYEYDQKSLVEIILGYNYFSDFLNQLEYLETLQNKAQKSLDELISLKKELEWQRVVKNSKKTDLEKFQNKLEEEKKRLDAEKLGRSRLLIITQEQEIQYQVLLEKAREEHQRVNEEIARIQREVQKKLEEIKKSRKWGGPIKGPVSFDWPIDPAGGISAYFLDPSYQAYFGVPHYGMDIRCPQGTPIKAAADAYVAKCRNAGYGYSYIMLVHNDEIATVYGHIFAFNVQEGQYVKKGDIIGLSGGIPGTLGAGWLTTGPHLHLEVRVNGSPVDALGYLP